MYSSYEVLVRMAPNEWWRGTLTAWRWIDEPRWEGWVEYRLRDDVRRGWVDGERLSPFPGWKRGEWVPGQET